MLPPTPPHHAATGLAASHHPWPDLAAPPLPPPPDLACPHAHIGGRNPFFSLPFTLLPRLRSVKQRKKQQRHPWTSRTRGSTSNRFCVGGGVRGHVLQLEAGSHLTVATQVEVAVPSAPRPDPTLQVILAAPCRRDRGDEPGQLGADNQEVIAETLPNALSVPPARFQVRHRLMGPSVRMKVGAWLRGCCWSLWQKSRTQKNRRRPTQ